MLELGAGADILRSLGWLYVGLTSVLVIASLWFPKRWWQKTIGVIVVLLVFIGPIYLRNHQRKQVLDEHKARYEAAKALFDERCKTAGERIDKTVDNVEGVMLLKIRQYNDVGKSSPMMDGAATAFEFTGDDYIRSFLLFEKEPIRASRGALSETPTQRPGYRFVDVIDPRDKKRYRYTLDASTRLQQAEAVGESPRYGVTYEDIVNPDERKYWVAGSTVKVLDLKTNETIAAFTRYVVDPGQGSLEGQRTPWLFARGCGMKTSYGTHSSRLFVDQVLKPFKGSSK